MADDQVALERGCLLFWDKRIGKFAEAGRQAVNHCLLRKLLVYIRPRPVDLLLRRFGNPHLFLVSGNRHDLLDRQFRAVEFNHFLSTFYSMCRSVRPHPKPRRRTLPVLLSYKLNRFLSIHPQKNIYFAQFLRLSC